jgi:hypothetical protein
LALTDTEIFFERAGFVGSLTASVATDVGSVAFNAVLAFAISFSFTGLAFSSAFILSGFIALVGFSTLAAFAAFIGFAALFEIAALGPLAAPIPFDFCGISISMSKSQELHQKLLKG